MHEPDISAERDSSFGSSLLHDTWLSTRPPLQSYDNGTSKQQECWGEMNRREKMDRGFKNATPEIDHQPEELYGEKSKEYGRLQWDQDWESQSRATTSIDSTDVALTALSAPITSEEPTAPKTPDIRSSKSVGGLAKFSEFLMKPFTKATETSRFSGQRKARKRMR